LAKRKKQDGGLAEFGEFQKKIAELNDIASQMMLEICIASRGL
jgi:hypothetical protein